MKQEMAMKIEDEAHTCTCTLCGDNPPSLEDKMREEAQALLDLVNACPVQRAARVRLNDLAKQVGTGARGGLVHYPMGLGYYLNFSVQIDRGKGKRPRRPFKAFEGKDLSTAGFLRVEQEITTEVQKWIAKGWKNIEEVKS